LNSKNEDLKKHWLFYAKAFAGFQKHTNLRAAQKKRAVQNGNLKA